MLIAAGQGGDIVMDLRIPGSHDYFEVLDGIVPHPDIGGHGILEQDDVLIDHGHRPGHDLPGKGASWLPVKEDLPAPGLIQAGDQLGDGGFAAAGWAHQGHPLTGL